MYRWHQSCVVVNILLWVTRAFSYALLNSTDPSTISSTASNGPSDPFIAHEDYYEVHFSNFHSPESTHRLAINFINAAARSLRDEMRTSHATNISFVPDSLWHYSGANPHRFELVITADDLLLPMIYAEIWTVVTAVWVYIDAWSPNEIIPSAAIQLFDHGLGRPHYAAKGLLKFGPAAIPPTTFENEGNLSKFAI